MEARRHPLRMAKNIFKRASSRVQHLTFALGLSVAAGATLGGTSRHGGRAPVAAEPRSRRPDRQGQATQSVLRVARQQIGVKENAQAAARRSTAGTCPPPAPARRSPVTARQARAYRTPRGARCSSPGSARRPAPAPRSAGTPTPSPTPAGSRTTTAGAATPSPAPWSSSTGTAARTSAASTTSAWSKKDNGDGTITTIEGNTGNGKVEERVRPTSQVAGYGYPEYAA